LNRTSVATLHSAWSGVTGAVRQFPGVVVANGMLYDSTSVDNAAAISAYDQTMGRLRWTTVLSPHDLYHFDAPAVSNGTIYVTTFATPDDLPEHLSAVNALTGKERWSVLLPAFLYSTPAVVANGVVFLSRDAFDAATGKLRWAVPDDDPHGCGNIESGWRGVSVTNGVVYFRCSDGSIESREVRTGTVRSIRPSSKDGTTPIVVGGVMYYGSDGRMVARDAATGALRWATPATEPIGQPSVAKGIVYAAIGGDNAFGNPPGSVEAFDAMTGKPKWIAKAGDVVSNVAIANGVVYVSTAYFTAPDPADLHVDLQALDAATGQRLRKIARIDSYGNIAVANGIVFVAPDPPPNIGVIKAFAA
jgi:outer membrane protein assembly factor BamB